MEYYSAIKRSELLIHATNWMNLQEIMLSENGNLKKIYGGTSLVVQWLRLRASTAGGTGSIPGQGTKIPHAVPHGQKRKDIWCMIPLCNICKITCLQKQRTDQQLPGIREEESRGSYYGVAQGSHVVMVQLSILIVIVVT